MFVRDFMKQAFKQLSVAGFILLLASASLAKLPALSDEGKAKAAEASAKAGWSAKVDAYQLCKSQDRVAAHINKSKAGENGAKVASTCVDPGVFVYPASVAGAAPSPAQGAASTSSPSKKL